MPTFTVHISGRAMTARLLPDESWQDAASRAAKRRFGRGADITSWRTENYEQNRAGDIVAAHFVGTVIGRRERGGNSYPVLGSAYVTWTPRLGEE